MSSETNTNPVAALRALKEVLTQRADRGQEKVWLTPDARHELEKLPGLISSYLNPPQATPAPVVAEEPAREAEPIPSSPPASKADSLAAIKARAEHCERCRSLGSLRDTMVFAVGNPEAKLMLVGEAPGAEEEKQREPFVGPAGQLLDKILKAMGLERSEVYISNIVKFRPKIGDGQGQGVRNRKPTAEEMAAAVQYVKEEIAVIQPKAIVALGGTAMEGLLGIEASVSSQRSRFHDLDGFPVMVTYHPSFLLRSGAISDKRKVWEDMLMVMEKLEMPISEKQQGYFL